MSGIFYPPKRRYRLYIDETGTDTLKDTVAERHLALMGLIFRQDVHDSAVHPRLEAIKADLFDHDPINNLVILHRSEIIRRQGAFAVLDDPKVETEFNSRFLALVSEAPYLSVTAAIDKDAHKQKYVVWQYNPYHYCMEVLLERFVLWLDRHDSHGDVVVEARAKKKDKKLKAAYEFFYNNGNQLCTKEMRQSRLISNSVKLCTKLENISALQLADLMAQPSHRFMKSEKLGEIRQADFGQSLVDILLDKKFMRNPNRQHLIWGWGLKWLP